MKIQEFEDGVVVCATFPDSDLLSLIKERCGPVNLTICDPPYGNIVDDAWDRVNEDDEAFSNWMVSWTNQISMLSPQGSALYVWGGIGVPGFRPFYRYASEVEGASEYEIADHITWAKKRAYGTKTRLLFCREECLYLVKGSAKKPRLFNVPYLDKLRGYEGYNPKYPAKSPYLRRTNVWTDISEIFKGKVHTAQKPEKLAEIMIKMHTEPGEWVLDPFCGSGSTGLAARKLGRKFLLVEKDPLIYANTLTRLSS